MWEPAVAGTGSQATPCTALGAAAVARGKTCGAGMFVEVVGGDGCVFVFHHHTSTITSPSPSPSPSCALLPVERSSPSTPLPCSATTSLTTRAGSATGTARR